METLEVIARPHFAKVDLTWLTDIRSRRADSRGAPYFTLVFAGADLKPTVFVDAVRAHVEGLHPIHFRLRSALVAPEPMAGCFHVFLIPDEGFGAILRLHDLLHGGAIKAALRLDRAYLPHITVATTSDAVTARNLALALNQGGIDIHGHIDSVQVESRVGKTVNEVADIPLAKAGWFG